MIGLVGGLLLTAAQSCADDPLPPSLPDGALADPPTIVDGGAFTDANTNQEANEASTDDAGAPCSASSEDSDVGCGPGFRCCVPCCRNDAGPVCVRASNNACPYPDLRVSEAALAVGMMLDTVEAGTCELEEQCLTGTGVRRVLRFDVRIGNHGTADLVLGRPDGSAGFEFASCHQHYHFSDFARYSLLDDAGAAVVVGRKQAFCARDDRRIDPSAVSVARFDCERQGIQRGWEDIYAANLPCQFLDITDVPPGTYRLEVEVNPGHALTELDYTNNRASVRVVVP